MYRIVLDCSTAADHHVGTVVAQQFLRGAEDEAGDRVRGIMERKAVGVVYGNRDASDARRKPPIEPGFGG